MYKIGFVVRAINKGGGVKMVVKNLLKKIDLLMFTKRDLQFIVYADKEYDFLRGLKNIKVEIIKKHNVLLWDNIYLYWKLKGDGLDCVVYPKNVIPPSNLSLKCKKMIIVHDLAHFKQGLNAYKFWDVVYMKMMIGASCRKSNHIFSISEFTKEKIVKEFNMNESKITVIHEGVEKKFKEINNKKLLSEVVDKYGLQLPFFLYPGSISPRKNILRILEVFNNIKHEIPHMLYFTGARGWKNKEVWEYIREKNLQKRVKKIGYVKENELPIFYNLADLCLYPSLYEGFGLPILEAQACGCPVLTSNVSSLPEVAGNGAAIVDPYSTEDIKKGILKILRDGKYREVLVKSGMENVGRYSWKTSAKKIVEKAS
ncbi:MAG: glycosyltransferase family 1 protein [Patescibacteria group bacterium]|nr:glycosyltransferase family 1 protein [Patescibacteria group bacterium]